MNELLNIFLDNVLPRLCVGCGVKLKKDKEIFCDFCYNKLYEIEEDEIHKIYLKNFTLNRYIDYFLTGYYFEKDNPIQNALHLLKYEGKYRIGTYFGKILAERYKDCIQGHGINLIVPIPLHHAKKAERGYNQSYFIAKGISEILNISIDQKSLKRERYTQTQTLLNSEQRKDNLYGAFSIKQNKLIKDKKILLVDDVCTTGSTLNECAKVLKNNGACFIVAMTIAFA